ncbi:MAG TPA: PadR family transcriptional regulator [Xanthomonadales bacterium]|nr:PadR family transcriptional regulator [Xanthomonadales bacterium]
MNTKNKLYQGTLDMLIFRSIATEPLHGWGIGQWLERTSGGHFSVPQGSLYPALHRLERQGLLQSRWMQSPEGRKAKYYKLTRKGGKALEEAESRWTQYASAVSKVIRSGGAT